MLTAIGAPRFSVTHLNPARVMRATQLLRVGCAGEIHVRKFKCATICTGT